VIPPALHLALSCPIFPNGRTSILLIGGDKSGNDRFYEAYVPVADDLYDEHLEELRKEGLSEAPAKQESILPWRWFNMTNHKPESITWKRRGASLPAIGWEVPGGTAGLPAQTQPKGAGAAGSRTSQRNACPAFWAIVVSLARGI